MIASGLKAARGINRKSRQESVGKNPGEAERKAQILKNHALGIEIAGEQKRIETTLSEACREFLEETRQHHRPKTYSQYKTALPNHICRVLPRMPSLSFARASAACSGPDGGSKRA